MGIVALDFDHTVADTGGDREPGYVMPKPMPGALEAIRHLAQRHTLIIFSARAVSPGGRKSIEDWLRFFGVGDLIHMVTAIKLPSIQVFLDDRAVEFRGWDTAEADIEAGLSRTNTPKSQAPGTPYRFHSGYRGIHE